MVRAIKLASTEPRLNCKASVCSTNTLRIFQAGRELDLDAGSGWEHSYVEETRPGVAAHAYHPRTLETEEEDCLAYAVSLGYAMRPSWGWWWKTR